MRGVFALLLIGGGLLVAGGVVLGHINAANWGQAAQTPGSPASPPPNGRTSGGLQ